jgi:hypothetical protein
MPWVVKHRTAGDMANSASGKKSRQLLRMVRRCGHVKAILQYLGIMFRSRTECFGHVA